ncbi:MAG: hypothetical protein M1358_05105 [Chloroflexi bacterium]|nr:hypothetical protein [Chloroflexota bacterium]
MPGLKGILSRRSFVGVAGLLTLAAGVSAFHGFRQNWADSPYEIVSRWPLLIGGEGLFLATKANPSGAELEEVGNWLRQALGNKRNVVVQIFDDPGAARVVRTGSRIVGEVDFSAAMAHQRASYVKRAANGRLLRRNGPPTGQLR